MFDLRKEIAGELRDSALALLEALIDSPAFLSVLIKEYRKRTETDKELDRLFGPATLNNIFPGGLAALKAAGFTRMDDIDKTRSVVDVFPASEYKTHFLNGLAGGWQNGPHPNTTPERASKWILKSAEFIALLRVQQMSLSHKEREATGYAFPEMAAADSSEVCKHIVDALIDHWKRIQQGQLLRRSNDMKAKIKSEEPPEAMPIAQATAWRYFDIGKKSKDLASIQQVVRTILDAATDTPARELLRKSIETARSSSVGHRIGKDDRTDICYADVIMGPVFLGALVDAYVFLTTEN